jgi:hypothetical protein
MTGGQLPRPVGVPLRGAQVVGLDRRRRRLLHPPVDVLAPLGLLGGVRDVRAVQQRQGVEKVVHRFGEPAESGECVGAVLQRLAGVAVPRPEELLADLNDGGEQVSGLADFPLAGEGGGRRVVRTGLEDVGRPGPPPHRRDGNPPRRRLAAGDHDRAPPVLGQLGRPSGVAAQVGPRHGGRFPLALSVPHATEMPVEAALTPQVVDERVAAEQPKLVGVLDEAERVRRVLLCERAELPDEAGDELVGGGAISTGEVVREKGGRPGRRQRRGLTAPPFLRVKSLHRLVSFSAEALDRRP